MRKTTHMSNTQRSRVAVCRNTLFELRNMFAAGENNVAKALAPQGGRFGGSSSAVSPQANMFLRSFRIPRRPCICFQSIHLFFAVLQLFRCRGMVSCHVWQIGCAYLIAATKIPLSPGLMLKSTAIDIEMVEGH